MIAGNIRVCIFIRGVDGWGRSGVLKNFGRIGEVIWEEILGFWSWEWSKVFGFTGDLNFLEGFKEK